MPSKTECPVCSNPATSMEACADCYASVIARATRAETALKKTAESLEAAVRVIADGVANLRTCDLHRKAAVALKPHLLELLKRCYWCGGEADEYRCDPCREALKALEAA